MAVLRPYLTLNTAIRKFYLWSASTQSASQNLLFQRWKNKRIGHRQKWMMRAKYLVTNRGKVFLIKRNVRGIIVKISNKCLANIRRILIIRGSLGVKTTTSKSSTMGDRWVSTQCSDNSLKGRINRWNQSDHSTFTSPSRQWPPKTRWHSNLIWCRLQWGMCRVYLCLFHTRNSSSSHMVHILARHLLSLLLIWASSPKIWSAEATFIEKKNSWTITYVNSPSKSSAP